jgi:hypothetical protein
MPVALGRHEGVLGRFDCSAAQLRLMRGPQPASRVVDGSVARALSPAERPLGGEQLVLVGALRLA